MADDLIALALNESFDAFKRMLQCAGTVCRKPRPKQEKQQDQKTEDKNLHRKRIRNRSGGMLRFYMQQPQQRRDRVCEQTVQDCGEPQLLRHKAALAASS